ncbi:acyl CoA:acetate/3-ketoacid CoA transferase [Brachybacterium avium]|uniref:Acyl CoA:acetate/3-ketoacid CoA transferase n=1 Tax=Brachybacterium avium TaxID=2017485 RepID=A0A220UDM0_9MICO|nr:CoA-transferase [Brachybacterium avium]ASK66227.1 acyl CoA:acetate/3-ketoacid CoA transferase [Brachybacterium avium]
MRFLSAEEAVALIPDAATVLVDGSGGGVNEPGKVLAALEERFLNTASPRGLTVVHISGMGSGNGDGIDHLAHEGLTTRVIGGHWAWSRKMQELAVDERIKAYCLPQGTLSHLLREIAGARPGPLSEVGIGTSVDPRLDGGRLNDSAVESINEIVELGGRTWIHTPSFPIDVTILRGTTADEHGNVSMEGEGLLAETLAAAQAAKAGNGLVIAQVRNRVPYGEIEADRVRVPGVLIDAIVVDPLQRLSHAIERDTLLEGRRRNTDLEIPPIPFTVRKVIARRAAEEVRARETVNLGFGMPDGVAAVLAEAGLAGDVTFTVEQGHVGGIPAGGGDFGMARNAQSSIDAGAQFDWYDGGGLDLAVLSFAQVDTAGNVNVSRFGRRLAGIGGFVNISQGAKRVIFVGTFEAGAAPTLDGRGGIALAGTGTRKFVDRVEQISFSGAVAAEQGKQILYITERAVFALTSTGLMLTEVAPGLDPERDVLAHMGFRPAISPNLREMSPALFGDGPFPLQLATVTHQEEASR